MRIRTMAAAVAALALVVGPAGPAGADIHVQAFGAGVAGRATVTPAWSHTPQPHTMTLGFQGLGAAYVGTTASAQITWDCQPRESEDHLLPDQRHGFTLTSLDQVHVDPLDIHADFDDMETVAGGAGLLVGRCSGQAADFPDDPLDLTCPYLLMAYARVGTVVQAAGLCILSWGPNMAVGDVSLHAVLAPTSTDRTEFVVAAAAFRYRA